MAALTAACVTTDSASVPPEFVYPESATSPLVFTVSEGISTFCKKEILVKVQPAGLVIFVEVQPVR